MIHVESEWEIRETKSKFGRLVFDDYPTSDIRQLKELLDDSHQSHKVYQVKSLGCKAIPKKGRRVETHV